MNLRSASRAPDAASCGPRASQVARRLTSALLIPTAPSSRSRWRDLDRPDRRRRASALPRLRSPLSARRSTAAIPAESPKQGRAAVGARSPEIRHKRASRACSLRASARIEAVVRAGRRCWSQGVPNGADRRIARCSYRPRAGVTGQHARRLLRLKRPSDRSARRLLVSDKRSHACQAPACCSQLKRVVRLRDVASLEMFPRRAGRRTMLARSSSPKRSSTACCRDGVRGSSRCCGL
jgi:hypothetical protein